MTFFTEIEQTILKLYGIKKDLQQSSNCKKAHTEGNTLPGFKLYYKAMVTETAWNWHKTTHLDKWK